MDKATKEEYNKAGYPREPGWEGNQTGCFTKEDIKSGFGKLSFNIEPPRDITRPARFFLMSEPKTPEQLR